MTLEILRTFALKNLAIVLNIGSQLMSQLVTLMADMMEVLLALLHQEDAPTGPFVLKEIPQLSLILSLITCLLVMQISLNYTEKNIR